MIDRFAELTIEDYIPAIKERDEYKCVQCGKERWTEKDGLRICLLQVQRKNPRKADSSANLETVCREHYTEMD